MLWIRPIASTRSSYRFKCSSCGKISHQVTGNCGKKHKEPFPKCAYKFCPFCGEECEDNMKILIETISNKYDTR